jgi:heptaprenyl diphosphate synthase
MLHTATLIHDDIVDKSTTRRGVPTIAHQFGSDVAVYAGDYLFVCCFKLLSDYASSLRSLQVHSRSMENILNGELGQMNERYNLDETVEQYIENISGKTAELFSLSCGIGALESGTTEIFASNAKKIGHNIGMAFQILDDLLDYTSNPKALGKPVLEDIRQGVYSLPLLIALKYKRTELTPLLQKRREMTDEDIAIVVEIIHASHALDETREIARTYTKRALAKIKKLPDEETHSREILLAVTEKLLDRKD